MATYGGGFRVSAAVSYDVTGSFSVATTAYTAPANRYAMVNVSVEDDGGAGGRFEIRVGAAVVVDVTVNATDTQGKAWNIPVGPGQAVVFLRLSGSSTSFRGAVSGVEFSN